MNTVPTNDEQLRAEVSARYARTALPEVFGTEQATATDPCCAPGCHMPTATVPAPRGKALTVVEAEQTSGSFFRTSLLVYHLLLSSPNIWGAGLAIPAKERLYYWQRIICNSLAIKFACRLLLIASSSAHQKSGSATFSALRV